MLRDPYNWQIFLHHLGVAGFLLAHGVSTAMLFRLRRERDRARIQDLIQFSGTTATAMYVSLLVLLIGGVWGALNRWGGQWWPWTALVILLVVVALMTAFAKPYYKGVSEALAVRSTGVPRKSDEELDAILRSPVPVVVAWMGFVGLVAILWLMTFKPW